MLSKWLRRIHMYAALFLIPWALMYAISTLVMNHHDENSPPPALSFATERESTYAGSFPDGATPDDKAAQILDSLDLGGRYRVGKPRPDGTLVVTRLSPTFERRITFDPATGHLLVEKAAYGSHQFWNQIHRRRGYEINATKEDAWGLSVDVFIASMLFWIVSGVWMWWELRVTRRWGAVALGAGIGLFVLFVVTM